MKLFLDLSARQRFLPRHLDDLRSVVGLPCFLVLAGMCFVPLPLPWTLTTLYLLIGIAVVCALWAFGVHRLLQRTFGSVQIGRGERLRRFNVTFGYQVFAMALLLGNVVLLLLPGFRIAIVGTIPATAVARQLFDDTNPPLRRVVYAAGLASNLAACVLLSFHTNRALSCGGCTWTVLSLFDLWLLYTVAHPPQDTAGLEETHA